MEKEAQFVTKPLINWFRRQKTQWELYVPKHFVSSTGWDLEARRKNQDLLIEAKFIDGPFLSSFTGLVTAPLAKRPQHFMKQKYRSWCYGICWAIGSEYKTRNIYQILFDYFIRNPSFWKHYCKDFHAKYIFFVEDNMVAKVPFVKLLKVANTYRDKAEGKKLAVRRQVADELMKDFGFN